MIQPALHQMKIALTSVITMMQQLKEEDLQLRPAPTKRSIGELLAHIAVLCEADLHIANGASAEDMASFYSANTASTLPMLEQTLHASFQKLQGYYEGLSEEALHEETTAYWGVRYSRYEWLLEILAHLYHHRAQLHTLLIYCFQKEINVALFE